MVYVVNYIVSSKTYTLFNYSSILIRKEINKPGYFRIEVPNPSSSVLSTISTDIEFQITLGNHTFYGVAKKITKKDDNSSLVIEGADYSIYLNDTYANYTDDSYPNASSNSSGRIVYWVNKQPGTIVSDLLTNTSISSGSINTSLTAGTYRFDNRKKLDIIKELAEVNNTEFYVNNNKQIIWGYRTGSSSSVKTYYAKTNCRVVSNLEDTSIGKCYRVIVLGRGDGTIQISGSYTSGSYNRSNPLYNKERVFLNNNITSTSVANQFAEAIYNQINDKLTNITITSLNPEDNVQLGDRITFYDLDGTNYDLRVIELEKQIIGDSITLNITCGKENTRMKGPDLTALIAKYGNLTEITGSTSKGTIETMTIDLEANSNSTAKAKKYFSLASVVSNVNDVISAKLKVSRTNLVYNTSTATGNAYSGVGISNASAYTNAGITNVSGGEASSGYFYGNYTDSISSTGWQSVGTTIYTGSGPFQGHCIHGSIYLAFGYTGGPSCVSQNIYVRAYNSTDGTYWPNSSGIQLSNYIALGMNDSAGNTHTGDYTFVFPFFIFIPYSWANKNYRLQYYVSNISGTVQKYVNYSYSGFYSHTHNNTYNDNTHTNNNSINDNTHSNSITRTTNNPSESGSLTINYNLNGNNIGSSSLSVGGSTSWIDITSQIKSGGLGTQYLEVYPTSSDARVQAQIQITYFSQSTV
ncbi:MAG: hypothetical protein QXL51_01030 [Candidatus Aenigmatarchaeota archaeon]